MIVDGTMVEHFDGFDDSRRDDVIDTMLVHGAEADKCVELA